MPVWVCAGTYVCPVIICHARIHLALWKLFFLWSKFTVLARSQPTVPPNGQNYDTTGAHTLTHTHLFVQLRSCRIHIQPLSSMRSALRTGHYWNAGTIEGKLNSWPEQHFHICILQTSVYNVKNPKFSPILNLNTAIFNIYFSTIYTVYYDYFQHCLLLNFLIKYLNI